MDTIEIPVKEFYKLAKQLTDDGMDTVVLHLIEGHGLGENAVPACINFEASTFDAPDYRNDYDTIHAV